ncbi:MAG TPA: hydrogenase maturation protease [Bryobacteraceae bacterium]|nr:hydrogenase maturation protease [Bryobacteraceae bacterium]
MKVCIIGCGNSDRGDDAAGLLVARRLQELGIEAREHSGEALELLEAWSQADRVVLIDAVCTGAPAGAVSVWEGSSAPVAGEPFRCSTHALGIAEAIALARVLDRMPPELRIYGIEGRRFGCGARPSPEVVAAVESVAQAIARELRSL